MLFRSDHMRRLLLQSPCSISLISFLVLSLQESTPNPHEIEFVFVALFVPCDIFHHISMKGGELFAFFAFLSHILGSTPWIDEVEHKHMLHTHAPLLGAASKGPDDWAASSRTRYVTMVRDDGDWFLLTQRC